MTNTSFDNDIRSALIAAARIEFDSVLAGADTAEIQFSAEYKRKMAKMLRQPTVYARRQTRTTAQRILRTAASIALVISILFGAMMLVPSVRAAVGRVVVEWFETHTAFKFTGNGQENTEHSSWYPEYIPEGYSEELYDDAFGSVTAWFENDSDVLGFMCGPSDEGFAINIDNEHSEEHMITINQKSATLYESTDTKYPSYIFWMSDDENTAFLLYSKLSTVELIKIAESVSKRG